MPWAQFFCGRRRQPLIIACVPLSPALSTPFMEAHRTRSVERLRTTTLRQCRCSTAAWSSPPIALWLPLLRSVIRLPLFPPISCSCLCFRLCIYSRFLPGFLMSFCSVCLARKNHLIWPCRALISAVRLWCAPKLWRWLKRCANGRSVCVDPFAAHVERKHGHRLLLRLFQYFTVCCANLAMHRQPIPAAPGF